MKHKIWFHHLISALIAFMLAVSAIGNIITGCELPVDSVWKVYLWCAVFALASSVLFRFRYGGRIIISVAILSLFAMWKREAPWQQTQLLTHIITSHYHYVYNWPALGSPVANDVSLPLILWGALVAVCVNWYIYRRKHILIALLPTIFPLLLCLLTTDRVPATLYLYLTILFLALLLISDWARTRQSAQGMKIVLRSVLPIAVSLALLFALNPREGYVNNAGKLQKEVVEWFEDLLDQTQSAVSNTTVASPVGKTMNLRLVGPKSGITYSIMRVNAPISGTLYLRGRDYDQYTGTGWESTSNRNEKFTSGGASLGELNIVTYGVRSLVYVPYYVTEDISLSGGAWENDENYQRYSFFLSRSAAGSTLTPDSRYTKLPEDTLQWAKDLAKEITSGTLMDREKINRIQDYVRSSAAYDLSTSRMDSEYSDFARWFLEESETGYCVHFATTATVLLRAAGIPARYVEGYMAYCDADSDVIVTNRDAHAWAEYFDSASGTWKVLEATPADLSEEERETTVEIPQTESAPEQTPTATEDSGNDPGNQESKPAKPNAGEEKDPELTEDSPDTMQGQDSERKSFRIPDWIRTVCKCLLFAACIPLQGYARIYRKRMLWNRGKPNARTMERWRQTRSLAKLLKQPYPEELESLAQKAKFSQHRIQPEELKQFEDYKLMAFAQIRSMPWYSRIILKYILAVD